jgi:hypothetical protein
MTKEQTAIDFVIWLNERGFTEYTDIDAPCLQYNGAKISYKILNRDIDNGQNVSLDILYLQFLREQNESY